MCVAQRVRGLKKRKTSWRGVEAYAVGAVVDMFIICYPSRSSPSSTCSPCCCTCGLRRAKNVAPRQHVHVCCPVATSFILIDETSTYPPQRVVLVGLHALQDTDTRLFFSQSCRTVACAVRAPCRSSCSARAWAAGCFLLAQGAAMPRLLVGTVRLRAPGAAAAVGVSVAELARAFERRWCRAK
jgi:hypothetical protein